MRVCNCRNLGLCVVCDWRGFRAGCRKRDSGPRQFNRADVDAIDVDEDDLDLSNDLRSLTRLFTRSKSRRALRSERENARTARTSEVLLTRSPLVTVQFFVQVRSRARYL